MEQDIKNTLDSNFKQGYLLMYLDSTNKVKFIGEMPITTLGTLLPMDKLMNVFLKKVVNA